MEQFNNRLDHFTGLEERRNKSIAQLNMRVDLVDALL